MKTGKLRETKFIATVNENKINQVNEIADDLIRDGVKVENISEMFGIINGKSKSSLEELKAKYKSKGLSIEPNRDVSI